MNGKWYFKASSTNHRQKVKVIANNKSKYKIRTMFRFLKLYKSTYYFNFKKKENKIQNNIYDEAVISAFKENKEVYRTRRLKVVLENKGISLSKRKIKEIVNKHNLISKYTKLSFKKMIRKLTIIKYLILLIETLIIKLKMKLLLVI